MWRRNNIMAPCLHFCRTHTANKLLWSIRDGPPTYSAPLIVLAVMGYLLVPRILQARMINFRSKVINSIMIVS
ncbi:unnamed protein product [Vitrella brassicaformis CCMP3155]|uniref:Uncharacterized protein n=1 Tax=Vitrella brassicaformis (strain CCMP3155) TaxID=1169540 RepID=A0A0G4GAK8_VITBC|nr:unnamed protein product [Vitrella brassicaformis CCMP3155]|eukprot:CEM25764.1 unnamed protein product [Vitrella brassicaformis CCMP3155]